MSGPFFGVFPHPPRNLSIFRVCPAFPIDELCLLRNARLEGQYQSKDVQLWSLLSADEMMPGGTSHNGIGLRKTFMDRTLYIYVLGAHCERSYISRILSVGMLPLTADCIQATPSTYFLFVFLMGFWAGLVTFRVRVSGSLYQGFTPSRKIRVVRLIYFI